MPMVVVHMDHGFRHVMKFWEKRKKFPRGCKPDGSKQTLSYVHLELVYTKITRISPRMHLSDVMVY